MANTLFPTNPLSTLLEATCYGSKETRAVENEMRFACATRLEAGRKIQIGKVGRNSSRYEYTKCELSHVTLKGIQSEDAVYELSGHSGEEFNHIPAAANQFFYPRMEEPAAVFVAPKRETKLEKDTEAETEEVTEAETEEEVTRVSEAVENRPFHQPPINFDEEKEPVAVIVPRFSEESFEFAE